MNINIYSILIPVHNEKEYLPSLLDSLKGYSKKGHEVIIIDDGSNDGSAEILKGSKMINVISLVQNKGKGYALKKGLENAINNKIIIFDGDMEIHPSEISKLMVLENQTNLKCVIGHRFESLNPIKSGFDWGNFMFTTFFNILFNSNHKDILSCAKAFYKNDIEKYKIASNGFDIDLELSTVLSLSNKKGSIYQVKLDYQRRTSKEGKKLKVFDGWCILLRILRMLKYL